MDETELPALDMNQMMNVAQQVAKHISTSTTQFTIHPDSVEAFPNGGGFDLDHPEGEYEGGSYVVVPEEGKHKIYNAATGNEYVGFVSPQGEVVFDGVYEVAKPDALVNKPEDSAVDEELTEAYVPSNIKDFAKRKGVSSLVNKVAGWAEKVGKGIRGGTAIGKNYSTLILDMTYQGGEISINTDNDTIRLYDEPVNSFPEFKRVYDEFGMEDEMTNEGYDEFKRVEKGKKKTVAKDKGEEDVYGAGVKKGEEIEKKKLKEAPENKEKIALKIANYFKIPVEKLNGFELDGTDDIEELILTVSPKALNNPDKKYQVKRTIETFIQPFNTTGPSSDEVYPYGLGRGQGFGKSYENKTTMKKSELKAKIKEMIVSEMNVDIDKMEDAPESEVDFLSEIEAMLNEEPVKEGVWSVLPARIPEFIAKVEELKDEYHAVVGSDDVYNGLDQAISAAEELMMNTAEIKEAEGDTEKDTAETETTTDVAVDDTETTDVETTAEVDPNVKAVQDSLTQAQAAAQQLGDKKLIDQIGNTITFFTRAHVVEKPKGAVAESMFPMLKKILK